MSISGVSNSAGYIAPVRMQPVAPPPSRATVTAAGSADSDGDNDGSKGGTVDVRA
jgi:hypothetical protein